METKTRSTVRSHRILNVGHGMVDPGTHHTDQLPGNVDRLRTSTLIVPTIPFLHTAFHLRRVIGSEGETLEAATSGHGTGRDEVVQQQGVEGLESATRTLDGLVDGFGRGVNPIRIVASGPHVLDVVPRLELLEALGTGIVDILSIGDELGRRRRSVGSRHFEWRTG